MGEEKLDEHQIELIVRDLLKSGSATLGSSSALYTKIQRVAAYLEILDIHPSDAGNALALSNRDFLRCSDRLWELLNVGVLAPGLNRDNPGLPWVHVTEYGRKILEADPNPYSAEEYIAELKKRAAIILDDVVEMYLFESLRSFKHNCYLSATVLLGGASERIFSNFLDQFLSTIGNPGKKTSFENSINNKFIATKFNEFTKFIDPYKKTFPREIKDQIDLWLSSFFNYIRRVRNSVGHPTGSTFNRGEVLAMFLPFHSYVENLKLLIDHFNSNPIT